MNRFIRSRAAITSISLLGAALVHPAAALGQPAPAQPAPSQPAPAQPAPSDEGDADVVDVPDAPPPPVPKDKGVITGTVVESSNGETIIEAQITVVGTQYKALSDIDGNYRIELPPGTYELRVFYEGHKARRVQKAVVVKGQTLKVDVSLEPQGPAVEEVVEIEVTPDRTSAATQVLIRKSSATVGDAVSAQDIAKTPDRNAAEAAKRVVGATILDGRFVYVRGLGQRYTNALLNGSPLPSPEPDRQAVPLDLFPSLVLSDISILKTFTPDMPGDFAGGSVSIHTRQPSDTFEVAATLSLGFNTLSTFRDRLSYKGGNVDFLGLDSGRRALPKGMPEYRLTPNYPKPDGTLVAKDEIWAAGRKINSSMATDRSFTPPNHGLNVVAGGTVPLGSLGKLGVTGALTYSRRFTIVPHTVQRLFDFDDQTQTVTTYKSRFDYNEGEIGNDQVSWGGLAVVSWSPSENHRFTLTGLTSRASDNETRVLTGRDPDTAFLEDTRLRFVSRGLFFGELAGEHKIRAWKGMELNYRVSGSVATLDEPDTRQHNYTVTLDPSGAVTRKDWYGVPDLSGQHFFGTQSDRSIGGALNLTLPLIEGRSPLKAKGGAFIQVRERRFAARRFHFTGKGGHFNEYGAPPDKLFSDEKIGESVDFEEWTQNGDAFVASQNLFAGYLMADWTPVPWLRAIGGARIESWSQAIDITESSCQPVAEGQGEMPSTQRLPCLNSSLDALPALALVLKTTKDSNLRASVSRTVARPQLLEVAPFLYTDYYGSLVRQGNPKLNPSSIINFDLRFEVFPGAADVFAVSAFFKQFYDPIEPTINSNTTITYQNARNARVLGMELEMKKGLGFISPALTDLSPLANVTLSASRVELDPTPGNTQTSNVRPLFGQSPVVVNLGLDYTNDKLGTRARLVYNVSAARLYAANTNGLLDFYEQPRHLLDAAIAQKIGKHVDLKLTAENILQAPYRVTFGSADTNKNVTVSTTKLNDKHDAIDKRQTVDKNDTSVDLRPAGTTFNLSLTVTN